MTSTQVHTCARTQHEHNGDNMGNSIGIEEKTRCSGARKTLRNTKARSTAKTEDAIESTERECNAKSTKINKENTKVRKKKANEISKNAS